MGEHDYVRKRSINDSEEESDTSIIDDQEKFDKLLLKELKPYECIYNVKSKEKKNIPQAWKNIAEKLGKSEEECESRYRRLREYTSKERKRRELNPESTNAGWPLYEQAQFLEPYIVKKRIYKKKKLNNQIVSSNNEKSSANEAMLCTMKRANESVENIDADVLEEEIVESIDSNSYSEINDDSLDFITGLDQTLGKDQDSEKDEHKDERNILMNNLTSPIDNINNKKEKVLEEKENETSNKVNAYDEESESLAKLVVSRLKKIKSQKKKDAFIHTIMDILFK